MCFEYLRDAVYPILQMWPASAFGQTPERCIPLAEMTRARETTVTDPRAISRHRLRLHLSRVRGNIARTLQSFLSRGFAVDAVCVCVCVCVSARNGKFRLEAR